MAISYRQEAFLRALRTLPNMEIILDHFLGAVAELKTVTAELIGTGATAGPHHWKRWQKKPRAAGGAAECQGCELAAWPERDRRE